MKPGEARRRAAVRAPPFRYDMRLPVARTHNLTISISRQRTTGAAAKCGVSSTWAAGPVTRAPEPLKNKPLKTEPSAERPP
ncbi:hypothetical protein GCM10010246_55480 [Streptomyces cuspidosporus]|uniref:Uncharacterized protein n=1 Tax=Streptomyces cuspidosporus TaxID=66882 RepID=A0ABP5TPW3_9ACTN